MKQLQTKLFPVISQRHWTPKYTSFSSLKLKRKVDDIVKALDSQGIQYSGSDLDKSYEFINRVFAQYHGRERINKKLFAFVVPTRITSHSDEYSSESFELMPILKYVDSNIRQRAIVGTPPCVVESYHHNGLDTGGCVVFAPIYYDITKDVKTKVLQYRTVKRIMKNTTNFIEKQLQVEIIGLGATLPKLTKLGTSIKNKSFVTTTGHGGTVWLIAKIYEKIRNEYAVDYTRPIGIIGGGAIGSSSAEVLLDLFPDVKIVLYDRRHVVNESLRRRFNEKYPSNRFKIAKNNTDVLEKCQITVSAITGKVDLSEVNIDLSRKVIIDDSQPGSFNAEQVNQRGGAVIWVIGRDNSSQRYATRVAPLNFGDEGLVSGNDVWGCEAEVATLAITKKYHHSIRESVRAEHVMNLHDSFMDMGIGVAPFQQKGTLVDLSNYLDRR